MSWNLEGLCIEAMYLNSIPVKGQVELSRVKYGGRISHHIALVEPVEVYGTLRDRVIVDHEDVVRVSMH